MSARQVVIPLCIDGHFYFTEESMKPKYAIVRVDDNMFCPAHFEKINNDFVCNYKAKCYDGYGQQLKSPLGCEKCKYGDTKEQLIAKIQQALFKFIFTEQLQKVVAIEEQKRIYKQYRPMAEKVVEFLGVTE